MEIKQKWFYPAQAKITAYLDEHFEDYQNQFQDVCKHVVYENYMARKGDETTYIQFVIHRNIGVHKNVPHIIQTYYMKYEDTMQYFQPE